jgi:hypothetical protein
MSLRKFLALIAFCGATTQLGCGDSGVRSEDNKLETRNSIAVSKGQVIKYIDDSPSLSADGRYLVYSSGKDATEDANVLKSYLVDLTSTGKEPARLSPADVTGAEAFSLISPNGSYALVGVQSSSGQSDLWLRRIDAAVLGSWIQITSDANVESSPSIASDGRKIAVRLKTSSNGKIEHYLRLIQLAANFGSVENTADYATDFPIIFGPVFKPESSSVLIGHSSLGESVFSFKTFDATLGVTSLTATATAVTGVINQRSGIALSQAGLLVVKENDAFAVNANKIVVSGTKVFEKADDAPKSLIVNQVGNVSDAGAVTVMTEKVAGVLVRSLSSGATVAVANTTQFFQCKDEDGPNFRTGLVVFPSTLSADNANIRIFPYAIADKSWKVADNSCDPKEKAEDEAGLFDFSVKTGAINQSATMEAFTVAYVSHFSGVGQQTGVTIFGDSEVRVVKFSAKAYEVFDISKNLMP